MSKKSLSLTVALIVVRDLPSVEAGDYKVIYKCDKGREHVAVKDTLGNCPDYYAYSVRIKRIRRGWETATPMKGWQVYAEAERRLNRARDPLRAKINDLECEYCEGRWRTVNSGGESYCLFAANDYFVQWPTEVWEDVTEEALESYFKMVTEK